MGGDLDAQSWRDVERPLVAAWTEVMENAADDGRWPSVEPGVEGKSVSLSARRTYAAAPADVWSAITEADRLSAWMAPATGDLRAGGTWTIAYDNGAASGTITECAPARRLVTTWRWAHEPDHPESTLTVELSDGPDGGTVVSLRHERTSVPGEGYAAGWYAFLLSLT